MATQTKPKDKATKLITVKVAQMGRDVVEVQGTDLTTEKAIRQAKLSAKGLEIRVNGKPATLKTGLKNGDTVVLAPKINGG